LNKSDISTIILFAVLATASIGLESCGWQPQITNTKMQITNMKIGVGTVNHMELANGIAQTPLSYTIWTSGGTTYAKNARTGGVSSGADAATVIQAAITALTNGGKIHLKNGTYTLSTQLTDRGNDNITVEGEGWNTLINVAAGFWDHAIYIRARRSNWVLTNFRVDGANIAIANGTHNNIYILGSNTLLFNVYSVNCGDHGGFDVGGSYNRIVSCYAYNNHDDGFIIRGSYIVVDGCVSDTTAVNNNYSLVTTDHVILNGNLASYANSYGIALENLGGGACQMILVANNQIRAVRKSGIKIYASSGGVESADDVLISNNQISLVTQYGIYVDSTKRITIKENIIQCQKVTWRGIYVGGSGPLDEVEIIGNTVNLPAANGIMVDFSSTGAPGTTKVDENTIFASENRSSDAITINKARSFTCSNNRILGSGALATNKFNIGILIRNTCVGGTCVGNSITGGSNFGIRLYDGPTDVVVANNYIEEVTVGIAEGQVATTPDYNLITNNDLRTHVTTKVAILGTHTIVRGNIGYLTEKERWHEQVD